MGFIGKITDTSGNTHPIASSLYGTCDTAKATAAKVATVPGLDKLYEGLTFKVAFANANDQSNVTLKVNDLPAKPLYGRTNDNMVILAPLKWRTGAILSITVQTYQSGSPTPTTQYNYVINDYVYSHDTIVKGVSAHESQPKILVDCVDTFDNGARIERQDTVSINGLPANLSDLASDSDHRTVSDAEKASWDAKSTFSGSYNDLTNKPNFATVATSGSYNDLSNKPSIPSVDNTLSTAGAAADAKATGDSLMTLNNALTSLIKEEVKFKDKYSSFTYAQGTIRATDGYITVGSAKGIYTPTPVYISKEAELTYDSSVYTVRLFSFNPETNVYNGYEDTPITTSDFYRICIRKANGDDVTLADASALTVNEKPWIDELDEDIKEVKETADTTASFFGASKNIVDTSKVLANGTGLMNTTTGEYATTGGTQYIYGTYKMDVGSDYVISKTSSYCYLCFYNEDGSYAGVSSLVSVSGAVSEYTFECAYPVMILVGGKSHAEQLVQIEKGTVATSYVPYYRNLSPSIQIMNETLINKKVLIIGDSISTGDTSAALYPGEKYGGYNKWVEKLIEEGFLSEVGTRNDSIHATGYVAEFEQRDDDYVHRIKAVPNPSTYDFVIINGCYNDWGSDVPLADFKDAVDEFYSYLTTHFTQAHICVMNSLRSFRCEYQNQVGQYQDAYNDYVKEVAEKYGLPFYDLYHASGFYPQVSEFRNMWTYEVGSVHDGVHPTKEWCDNFMAPLIRKFVSQYI